MPAIHVAAELGVSSVTVAAIAKKLGVPGPPAGHWARVAAGQPGTRKPPLPNVSHAHPKVHVLHARAPLPQQLPPVAPDPVPLVAPDPAPVETPTDPDLTEDVHHVLLETALDHAQDLDRAERLRALANALEPRIRALPPEAPQRAWLTWARTTVAATERDLLQTLVAPGQPE